MRFVAGRGAAAESHREYVAGRGAVAESLCGRGCSPAEAVAAAAWKRLPLRGSQCGTNGRTCCYRCEAQRGTIGKHMRAGRSSASREKQCGQGEAMRARRSNAGKEKQCWQGEAMLAGRSNANRDKQCGLLVDEDGEVVPSEYLLRHSLEL